MKLVRCDLGMLDISQPEGYKKYLLYPSNLNHKMYECMLVYDSIEYDINSFITFSSVKYRVLSIE